MWKRFIGMLLLLCFAAPSEAQLIWYTGDAVNGGLFNNTVVPSGPTFDYSMLDDFSVPSSSRWHVTGVFTNNVASYPMSLAPVTQARWSIRTGVAPGVIGNVVQDGVGLVSITPTGRTFGSGIEYTFLVSGLSVDLEAGIYFLAVSPITDTFANYYSSETNGASRIGSDGPYGCFQDNFEISDGIPVDNVSQCSVYSTVHLSMGVVGTSALVNGPSIPARERAVLDAIYSQTQGASWIYRAGWEGNPGTECKWFGITCDATSTHVTQVELGANNLVGTLPSLIGLPALTNFDVGANQLTGSIPSLDGLRSLQFFQVGNNQLIGQIPSLAGLNSLTVFDVSMNQLTGSIPPLAGLPTFDFVASDNQLTGQIPSFGNTTVDLFVANNQLTGKIPSISGLGVTAMDVSHNHLIGPVPSLDSYISTGGINHFYISFNQLTGAIPALPPSLLPIPSIGYGDAASVCPNQLTPASVPPSSIDMDWNASTGSTPWSSSCITPLANQTITFETQTQVAYRFAAGETFAIYPSATASSGLPVSYTSNTPSVCTINATVVTMVAAGICTIAADQSGNALFNSAGQETQSINLATQFPILQGFVSLQPSRILDTRSAATTTDGLFAGVLPVIGGTSLNLTVLGRGGVPFTGVKAVVLNITSTNPTEAGYATIWSTGGPLPYASNLNFVSGQTIPNLVIAEVGLYGQISLFNSNGSTDFIADVVGYFADTSDFASVVPQRLLDTRIGGVTSDALYAGIGSMAGGSQLALTIAGRGGVPKGAGSVVLNVTATTPSAPGYLTVWPTDSAQPLASNLNFVPGQTIPNLVISKLSNNGQISLFNSAGNTDVIADVMGWFPASSQLTPVVPARLLDTRPRTFTIDGQFVAIGALSSSQTIDLVVVGRGNIPSTGVGAVVLNVTATNPTAAGFLTVWPSGISRPYASSLNFVPGQTIPNLVIAKVGSDGEVSLFNSAGTTDVVVDVVGWFSSDQ